MKNRIGTLLTVLLACFALSAVACDKKDSDKKNNKTVKKGTDKNTDKGTDKNTDKGTDKNTDKGTDKNTDKGDKASSAMHAVADKLVAMSKELCACKDKACAGAKGKQMSAVIEGAEKTFGKKEPPDAVKKKFDAALKAMNSCLKKFK